MDDERERELMRLAGEAAVFFKQLVRDGVPEKYASDITAAWILSLARKETVTIDNTEPPRKKEEWEF